MRRNNDCARGLKIKLVVAEGEQMNVFVVITHYMDGIQDAGVFESKGAAQAHVTTNNIGGKPEISEYPVTGELTEAGTVFTAALYDPIHDSHIFNGVYGSYEQAKKVAGERGLVLSRKI